MQKQLHPQYFTTAKISCACGNILTVGSTVENISVEICSVCHPFYTGKQKLVDTAGRVEKFQRRVAKKAVSSAQRLGKKVKKARSTERKKTSTGPVPTETVSEQA